MKVEELAENFRQAALTTGGVVSAALRRAVHDRAVSVALGKPAAGELPDEIGGFVEAVAAHSNDADVTALMNRGRSEDEVFELAVVSAVAAGLVRMEQGLRAVRGR